MVSGREDLLGQLGDLLKKRTASLVTCRGRRRIGKSTLVEEFARRTGFPGGAQICLGQSVQAT